MAKVLYPVYQDGTKFINSTIGVKTILERSMIVYFNQGVPIHQHHQDDYRSFRYITFVKSIRSGKVVLPDTEIIAKEKKRRYRYRRAQLGITASIVCFILF